MSKATNKLHKISKSIDYKSKWEESRQGLVSQLKEHLEKSEYHKGMATKAQGVIEVNDQLFAEEDDIES